MRIAGPRGQALAEAVGLTLELEQVATMGEPIEQGSDHACVVIEDGGPVAEFQVAGDRERSTQ